jgi:hypothetical protein
VPCRMFVPRVADENKKIRQSKLFVVLLPLGAQMRKHDNTTKSTRCPSFAPRKHSPLSFFRFTGRKAKTRLHEKVLNVVFSCFRLSYYRAFALRPAERNYDMSRIESAFVEPPSIHFLGTKQNWCHSWN